jgi:hypothetical protein
MKLGAADRKKEGEEGVTVVGLVDGFLVGIVVPGAVFGVYVERTVRLDDGDLLGISVGTEVDASESNPKIYIGMINRIIIDSNFFYVPQPAPFLTTTNLNLSRTCNIGGHWCRVNDLLHVPPRSKTSRKEIMHSNRNEAETILKNLKHPEELFKKINDLFLQISCKINFLIEKMTKPNILWL